MKYIVPVCAYEVWDDSIDEFRKVLEMRGSGSASAQAWSAVTNAINALCQGLRGQGHTPPPDIDQFYRWDEAPKPRPPCDPPNRVSQFKTTLDSWYLE